MLGFKCGKKECRQLIPHEIIPVWNPAEHSTDRRLIWLKEAHNFPTGPKGDSPFVRGHFPLNPSGHCLALRAHFTPLTPRSFSLTAHYQRQRGHRLLLPNWHVLPVHWGGHTHSNPSTKSWQVPPWEQLLGEQSSMSDKKKRGGHKGDRDGDFISIGWTIRPLIPSRIGGGCLGEPDTCSLPLLWY